MGVVPIFLDWAGILHGGVGRVLTRLRRSDVAHHHHPVAVGRVAQSAGRSGFNPTALQ